MFLNGLKNYSEQKGVYSVCFCLLLFQRLSAMPSSSLPMSAWRYSFLSLVIIFGNQTKFLPEFLWAWLWLPSSPACFWFPCLFYLPLLRFDLGSSKRSNLGGSLPE